MEWRVALTSFESFGAARKAVEVRQLMESTPHDRLVNDAEPATAVVFTLDGDIRTVRFLGETTRLPDLKGFRYIERLLTNPGREIHVLDMVAVERGSLPRGHAFDPGRDELPDATDRALPVIDDAARAAYRRRLAEVDDDIDEATRLNDPGRVELAQRDRDYLIAELTSAVGLGGRARSTGGTAERARSSVTRSLRYALKRLAEHQPALAAHLENGIHTGMYCMYRPDPIAPLSWNT